MSKFADDTKLCHRTRNPDNIPEQQEDINKLVEWANKWQMSFNVDKCSVMHIGHNNMESNNNMSNQQLPTTDQQRDQGLIITKTSSGKNKQRKGALGRHSNWVNSPQFQVQKQCTHHPIIHIPSPSTSRTCRAILVPTFKARHC